MPTYEYRCRNCHHRFDIQQSITDEPLSECPECAGDLRKVFHPVGIAFKGSGFYKNDARSDSGGGSGSTTNGDSSGTATSGAKSGASESSGSGDSGSAASTDKSSGSTSGGSSSDKAGSAAKASAAAD